MASDPPFPHVDPMGGLFDFKAMFDAMEVARRNWSAMPVPSSLTPTIDPAELDKRIADLKTVEQWLVLNLNLLRGSIQALELQRAALASLQSFGEAARAAAEAATQAGSSAREADRPATSSAPPGGASEAQQTTSRGTRDHAEAPASHRAHTRATAAPPAGAAVPAWTAGIDPATWWQTLQSQFQQVAESALSGIAPAATDSAATPPDTHASARGPSADPAAPPRTTRRKARRAAKPAPGATAAARRVREAR